MLAGEKVESPSLRQAPHKSMLEGGSYADLETSTQIFRPPSPNFLKGSAKFDLHFFTLKHSGFATQQHICTSFCTCAVQIWPNSTTGATSDGLKLQCIAIATCCSYGRLMYALPLCRGESRRHGWGRRLGGEVGSRRRDAEGVKGWGIRVRDRAPAENGFHCFPSVAESCH